VKRVSKYPDEQPTIIATADSTPPSGAKAEFDEEAARQESYRLDETEHCHDIDFFIDNYSFIEGARWQHSRDSATIEKLQLERDEAKLDVEIIEKKIMAVETQRNATLSAKDAEIERLREALKFYGSQRNYELSTTEVSDDVVEFGAHVVMKDGGTLARQALGEKGDG
jgi:hypothetical protein